VLNVTTGQTYPTIPAAITAATGGHEILASSLAFAQSPAISFSNKSLLLRSEDSIVQPSGGTIDLTQNATLATAPGKRLTVRGLLRSLSNAVAQVDAGELLVESGATLRARLNSNLDLVAMNGSTLNGSTAIEANAVLGFSGPVTNNGSMTIMSNGMLSALDGFINKGSCTATSGADLFFGAASTSAAMNLPGVTLAADSLHIEATGLLTGYGEYYSELSNEGTIVFTGNTLWAGDITNGATGQIRLQMGTTTLIGALSNNGGIAGQFQGGSAPAAGDGLAVIGDYLAAPHSSLLMPHANYMLSVSGDYSNGIDSNDRHDMAQATLQLDGLVDMQMLEAMSRDIGRNPAGLDRTQPGHFPIGRLRIGPTNTTVGVVDHHDNDALGEAVPEAIYVDTLQIDAGATLLTPQCRVYYRTLINNGTIADSANVVPLCTDGDADEDGVCDAEDLCPGTVAGARVDAAGCPLPIPGDFDADGDVDSADFAAFFSCAGGPSVAPGSDPECGPADFDDDADVDAADFAIMQRCYSGENVAGNPACRN